MEMEALNKYLEATQHHLGVEGERYGGGFRAIVAHRLAADFLFDKLDGDDYEATEAQAFLGENPLFPSAWGNTPQEAIKKLNAKIALLYEFVPTSDVYKCKAQARFELKAQYDAAPGEDRGWYNVSWNDIVKDLQSESIYYYEASKEKCGNSVKRDLHALRNFNYDGEFAVLAELT